MLTRKRFRDRNINISGLKKKFQNTWKDEGCVLLHQVITVESSYNHSNQSSGSGN